MAEAPELVDSRPRCSQCGEIVTGWSAEPIETTLGPNAYLLGLEPDLWRKFIPGVPRCEPCGHIVFGDMGTSDNRSHT